MAIPDPTLFSASIVPLAAEDANIQLKAACRADKDPRKVDISLRSYQDEKGEQNVFPVVQKAEEIQRRSTDRANHDYLPIAGLTSFNDGAAKLVLGNDSPALRAERVISFQTISGTGAIHLGALFLSKFVLCLAPSASPQPTVYISDPTWGNHHKVFANVGFSTAKYPYFSVTTKGLDLDGMLECLQNAPSGSIIVLQACGHNPTGVDPRRDQWEKIADVLNERRHVPFIDFTYQGMASGDLDQDAWPIRRFVDRGLEMFVAQSFAKNCSLYGQRVGCLHVVTANRDVAQRIASQLKLLQRWEISSPPAYGARVVSLILNDEELLTEWKASICVVAGRLDIMRKTLRSRLEAIDSSISWAYITDQIGMYCFLGLSDKQVARLQTDFHVYTTKNGRISVAGLTFANVNYVALALNRVMRIDA